MVHLIMNCVVLSRIKVLLLLSPDYLLKQAPFNSALYVPKKSKNYNLKQCTYIISSWPLEHEFDGTTPYTVVQISKMKFWQLVLRAVLFLNWERVWSDCYFSIPLCRIMFANGARDNDVLRVRVKFTAA